MEKSKLFYINSDNRTDINDSHSNFRFRLNIPNDMTHCCVLHANIPISYYLIREHRNTFEVSEDNGNTYTTITLPNGNYLLNTLKLVLEETLNNNLQFTYTINTPDINTEADTGTFEYVCSNNNNVQPIFKFDINNNIYEVLGFPRTKLTYQFENNKLTSGLLYLVPEPNIYLHSDIVDDEEGDRDDICFERA